MSLTVRSDKMNKQAKKDSRKLIENFHNDVTGENLKKTANFFRAKKFRKDIMDRIYESD